MKLSEQRIEDILRGRNRVLQELARGSSLEAVLTTLTRSAEEVVGEMRCSVLVLDEGRQHLRHGAAPSLPDHYVRAVDGLRIGPEVGSCGAAAYFGRRVVVEDVEAHPNWRPFLDLVRDTGFRACWSEPIFSTKGEVLGTFAMYYDEVRKPNDFELRFIETTAQVAGIAIERTRTEEARLRSQERLRAIVNTAVDGIITIDETGTIEAFNPAAERLFGYQAEEMIGSNITALMPEDYRRLHDSGVERFLSTGERRVLGRRFEAVALRKDGSTFPIDLAVSEYSVGAQRWFSGIVRDITERKEAETSLLESELRFRQLAEHINEVFWLTDWDKNQVLYVSPAYEKVWGRSSQSLYDDPKSWSYDIHPDDRQRVVDEFEKGAASSRYDLEYRIVRPDGVVRWIYDRCFPVKDDEGRVYRVAGLSEDVTDRKRVEQELVEMRDELDERRKGQIRSLTSELLLAEERERRRLAVDLHDGLNQTVTLALMKLSQLRARAATEHLTTELAEVESLIESANESARSLTFQLSPPVLHDLGFVEAVQWLVEDVLKVHDLKVELEELGQREELEERVRVLLFRALRELLINVAKHAKAELVSVGLSWKDGAIRITVKDDGVAFDTAMVGSRGIGLFAIRERLNHLGGNMTIRSRRGQGTRVTLVAPVAVEGEVEA